jgi:hypothetical protein
MVVLLSKTEQEGSRCEEQHERMLFFSCVRKDLLLHLCKMIGQKEKCSTGYETWIFQTWEKSFVNLDVQVNERRIPLNQKSKLNHELIRSITWKLGNLDVKKPRMDTPLLYKCIYKS